MTENYDVAIIGAGAAGMMCAIEAGKRGRRVIGINLGDDTLGALDSIAAALSGPLRSQR